MSKNQLLETLGTVIDMIEFGKVTYDMEGRVYNVKITEKQLATLNKVYHENS